MVLESVLAELLNRYMGDYVENLDAKQLNLGIWGGDVKLSNLQLKSSALDDLDLPFKVQHGRLSKLVLKIPWKNLYKQPVIVTVNGLYLVAVPNAGLQYNQEKEEKEAFEAKERELRRLEDAKKLRKSSGNASAVPNDTFVEKIATNIIKNLQIDISDIHIRFEDNFSCPSNPFACGVTLKKLNFVTTGEDWLGSTISDLSKFVYKLVNLEALSVYWSPELKPNQSFTSMTEEELTKAFEENIAEKDKLPPLSYVLEPIHLTCNLRLNPKPENDQTNFQIPKIDLRLALESLSLSVTRKQYEGIILFADALDTMTLKSKYRKYEPSNHPIAAGLNAKEWWHYAQRCILEADVRPRLRGWSWPHIKDHREKLRKYRKLYTQKLIASKPNPAANVEISALERDLTVFNILLMRQQAEMDAKKLKAPDKDQNVGWWGWMTGKGKQPKVGDADLEQKLAEIMTSEEKKKLYDAIDYREGTPIAMYPKTFIENQFDVKLHTLSVSIVDDITSTEVKQTIILLALSDVQSKVQQRPSAGALKVEALVGTLNVLGTARNGRRPELMVSAEQPTGSSQESSSTLLDVVFETKPLNSEREYRVSVVAYPVRAVYDAPTINGLVKFFRPPEVLHLKQLQVAAVAKLQELRESSAAGLRFALETHKEIDLDVHLNASYLVIPEEGLEDPAHSRLIIDFGDLRMKNMIIPERTRQEVIQEESLYDKYSLSIEKIQVIFSEAGEDWQKARKVGNTPMHLLQPLSCALEFHQCILQNDSRYAMIRVIGELASIDIQLTDVRLLHLARLGLSIPLPEASPLPQEDASTREAYQKELRREAWSMARVNKDLKAAQALYEDHPEGFIWRQPASGQDEFEKQAQYQDGDETQIEESESGEEFFDAVDSEGSPRKRRKSSRGLARLRTEQVNFTSFQMRFAINEVSLNVFRGQSHVPLIQFYLKHLITEMFTRTFDFEVKLALVDLIVDYSRASGNDKVRMVRRYQEHVEDSAGLLLQLDYRSAQANAPNFAMAYNNTLQTLSADFVGLNVVLDREALVELKQFIHDVQDEVASIMPPTPEPKTAVSQVDSKDAGGVIVTEQKNPGVILMDIQATLHTLTISLLTGKRELAFTALRNISAKVVSDSDKMDVSAQLRRIKLKYPVPLGLYTHIVRSVTDDDVLSVHYVGFTQSAIKNDINSHDMAIQLNLGAVQIVFLNKFVVEIVDFFSTFQTAQAKLLEATSAATESAMQSVKSAYEDAIRIKMDINIRAPVVFIPQHSRSSNAILADLGTLVLRNAFKLTKETAILDEMQLDFAAVRLSRVVMGSDQNITKEINLLSQPQPLELQITRNLSSWFTGVPDLSVIGGLRALQLRLSKFDYAILLAVLAENFAEGGPPPAPPKSPLVTPDTPLAQEFSSGTNIIAAPEVTSRLTKIKVAFSVANISARLYLTELPDVRHKEKLEETEALCGLEIDNLQADVEMFNDNSMLIEATLKDIGLADLRGAKKSTQSPNRKMLERKRSSKEAASEKMLIFVMKQLPNTDRIIDVIVSNFQANLALSFYLGVLEFVTSTPVQEQGPTPERTFEISELGTSLSIVDSSTSSISLRPPNVNRQVSQMTVKTPSDKVQQQQLRPTSNMRINVVVKQPEIILIENPALEDSRVLVVKTEVTFVMNVTPEISSMDLSCTDLEMFLATYQQWNQQLKQILLPVTIGMHASTPFGGKQKIAVSSGYINLTISPVAVQTILGVLSGMGQTSGQEVKMEGIENHQGLWKSRPLERDKLWFLNYSTDEEEWLDVNIENAIGDVTSDAFSAGDQLTLNTEAIVVVFESTYGARTIPMLLMEAKFNCVVDDFSSKMHCLGTLQIEMAYYNDLYDVWESLLEPVEDDRVNRPWQVQLDVKKNLTANESVQSVARMAGSPANVAARRGSSGPVSSSTSMNSLNAQSEALKLTAAMTVNINAMEPLNLTVSRKTLDVLYKMTESFTVAVSNSEMIKFADVSAPYVVYNDTGLDVVVALMGTLKLVDSRSEMPLKHGQRADLFLLDASQQMTASVLKMQERMSQRPPMIRVKVGSKSAEILVSRAETRFYFIDNPADPSKPYRLIAEIQSEMGHKKVILRSTMQIENLLPISISVFTNQTGGKSVQLGRMNALDGLLSVPISLVQSYDSVNFCWRPELLGFLHSTVEVGLRDMLQMANDGAEKCLQCDAKVEAGKRNDNFFFNLFVSSTPVKYGNTHTVTPNSRDYKVHLKPMYSIANLLPVPLHVRVEKALAEPLILPAGESASMCYAISSQATLVMRIENYAAKDWTSMVALNTITTEDLINLTMTNGSESLNLGIRAVRDQGTTFLTVYSPVWIMNKTGLKLNLKDPVVDHRDDFWITPILFGGKTLNSKKKVAIQVESDKDSSWSEKFSLDTVGSSGVLSCNKPDGTLGYEFGISIKPSAGILTRLAIITPYFVFKNDSDVDIGFREEHPDGQWLTVAANSCQAFWPQYLSEVICCRIEDTPEQTTSAFTYKKLQTTLLRLNNKYGGIYVQTNVSDYSIATKFSLYRPGTAAALLINDTRKTTVLFKQQDYDEYAFLPPQAQILFTWPLPSLDKIFVWKIDDDSENPTLDFNKDTAGLLYLKGGEKIFWVAFLDGVQRVLLFTDKDVVAQQCARSLENEISNIEVNLELNHFGLSLVDNKLKKEILFIGIVSPGAVWNGRKVQSSNRRWKPLSASETHSLESAYQQFLILRDKDKGRKSPSSYTIQAGEMEVTFDGNGPALITRPKPKEIQRKHEPGLWCRFRSSDHHTQSHLKLHKMQIDNPISGSRYQVVLFPSPPPATAEYKPFIEVSVVLRNAEKSAVTQYKLATALIQEFELRVDQTFLNAILALFSGESTNAFKESEKMLGSFKSSDLSEISRSLDETVAKGFGEERLAYYEKLILQPIKIHLSFSLSGGRVEQRSGIAMPAEFISLFIKSIGVTITEANDVVLKLGTFERDYRFISQKQLISEVSSHYTTQVVKQVYMLVFGLDILGNPFGLVRGITDGVKDLFYEPYLGAVEGPEEFMTGLGSGFKNFVGSTVGGTMGAVGRVTGTLGRAMAALSFDQEFQERRQAELNRSNGDFAGGMASSGRHLVTGLFEGVTGVVRRPLEGAKEEGVEGFVKGLGKGLLGFIARPTTGLIDFASGSLNTIGRAVKGDNSVEWLRAPRFIPSDGIIRPYNCGQAEGGLIFNNLKNGEYVKTDEYVTHLVTSRDRRYILMLTSKRVICLEKGDVIHDWNIEWTFPIDQMPEPPNLDDKGLCVYITDADNKGIGGFFSKQKKSKRVFIEDRDAGRWFCSKVTALWKIAHDKS